MHERVNLLLLQTLESWRQSLALNQKPQTPGTLQETLSQMKSSIVFKLKLPKQWKIHNIFHASLLSLYRKTLEHGPNFPQPPPEPIGTEEEYEINKIINHQGTAARRQYLIHWKGYSDAEQTWKLESNLGNALSVLKEYKN